ncbi:MAG: hypothetical protein FWD71_16250 [Oscillospiraceae bacterium]|nr:hypothetical protein [Oscillospiraceae bacterium]
MQNCPQKHSSTPLSQNGTLNRLQKTVRTGRISSEPPEGCTNIRSRNS